MEQALVYGAYAAAGFVAAAVYSAMPKEGRPTHRGVALVLLALALGGVVMLLGHLLGERGSRVYFYILGVLAVAGAVRVVTHPRPVYSALYFVMVVLSTAALMVVVGAEFLGAALVIVYAGAILVTYVFVIMMAQQSPLARGSRFGQALDYDRRAREPGAAVLAGFVLMATVAGVIVGRGGGEVQTANNALRIANPVSVKTAAAVEAANDTADASPDAEGNTLILARAILPETGFPVSLQVAGVLLMIAMVGAITIAKKRLPQAEEEVESRPAGEIGKRAEPF
ncbi:MAG: NADH-quinone oxidoreductase subunit J [Phycisphaerae bacterium]|nr:NADH-quinone oxidoreductase subunit J [Phycisphaerae bacterium]